MRARARAGRPARPLPATASAAAPAARTQRDRRLAALRQPSSGGRGARLPALPHRGHGDHAAMPPLGTPREGAHFDGTPHHRSGWKGDCQLLARRGLRRGVGGRDQPRARPPQAGTHRGHAPAREHTWRCANAGGTRISASHSNPLAVSREIARLRNERALQGDMLRRGDWLHLLVLSCQVTLVIRAPRREYGDKERPRCQRRGAGLFSRGTGDEVAEQARPHHHDAWRCPIGCLLDAAVQSVCSAVPLQCSNVRVGVDHQPGELPHLIRIFLPTTRTPTRDL